ncbi:hypothetical protein [Mycolicibacterium confluentis]|uniref:Uncharacterized protein n=1 Tax=Mycolicibacterium confluentis TaxID=28047 RepID=A0A7I7Y0H2_9MYCO|nr:hypothetical protein [Mycolicibacterium confluentis]MCV7320093.1 hypothetical protein [Mycolicibacterium confluentis]ORV34629.1 hypothetical protein AWB99_03265 [Mycolicibacterium confluentis]BBZ35128.1 hypothetical protein MCNF_37330 [Mycolicibacterium confluentis]
MTTDDGSRSEYDPIIEGVQEAAEKALKRATKVATQASRKINREEYTARDLILTMTEMVEIAATGGAEITRRSMTNTPPGLKQVAEYSRAVGRRFMQEARGVSSDATARIDKGTYDVDDVVMSMTRLVDFAIVGGLEVAQTLFSGPAQFDAGIVEIPIDVPPGEAGHKPKLGAVKVCRYGDDEKTRVPSRRITFEPAPPDEAGGNYILRFRTRELPSGVYTGTAVVDGQTVGFDFSVDAT